MLIMKGGVLGFRHVVVMQIFKYFMRSLLAKSITFDFRVLFQTSPFMLLVKYIIRKL